MTKAPNENKIPTTPGGTMAIVTIAIPPQQLLLRCLPYADCGAQASKRRNRPLGYR